MATKSDVLAYIKRLAEQNIVTRDELDAAYDSGKGIIADVKEHQKSAGITEIMYYIGGGIIFLGIVILIAQNWSELSVFTRILATLGSGIAAYYAGILLNNNESTKKIGNAFFLLSSLTLPIGILVTCDASGMDISKSGVLSFVSITLVSVYMASYFLFKKTMFVFFSIIFGTWFYFSFLAFMVGSSPDFNTWQSYMYRILVAGISYALIGYSLSKSKLSSISDFLYGLAAIAILSSTLTLGSFRPNQDAFWELIYPALIFGALYASVYIKSKSVLTLGTIFLMIYILKITSEYFSSGLGWPLALVMAGLFMIAVSYMSITIKNKYLSSK
jgi:uncharacterized membrane protein